MKRNHSRTLGILVWIMAYAVLLICIRTSSLPTETGPSLIQYFVGPNSKVTAKDSSARLRIHDPVFFRQNSGDWTQIGYVTAATTQPEPVVEIAWNSTDLGEDECQLICYQNDGRLASVVATLLPPEKRELIQRRLTDLMTAHGDELSAAFVPLVEMTLKRSIPAIESEIRRSIASHQDEIDKISLRWNKKIVEERLIPLARREILPIVRRHGEPTATKIGRKLWDSASMWRFGWRLAYDRSPLPTKNLAQLEWERFVESEAIPIFEEQMKEIVASVQRVVRDVAANEAVQNELAGIANEIAADPQSRALLQVILKESLIDNEQLRKVWSDVWAGEEASAALNLAGDRLEPIVRKIGDDLFGTQETGIDPNFARVLRNQVLGKDRRWIVAVRTGGGTKIDGKSEWDGRASDQIPTIEIANDSMMYPIVHVAVRER